MTLASVVDDSDKRTAVVDTFVDGPWRAQEPALLEASECGIHLDQLGEADVRELLLQNAGDTIVALTHHPQRGANSTFESEHCTARSNFYERRTTLREAWNTIIKTRDDPSLGTVYAPSGSLAGSEELHRHFSFPLMEELLARVALEADPKSPRLWLGAGGQRLNAHIGNLHNFAIPLLGYKDFWLFPPEQTENLYMGPWDDTKSNIVTSLADVRDPDFDKYPKLKTALAHVVKIRVKPGQVLYLPPYWWHDVQSSDFNVMVNYWWSDVPIADMPSILAVLSSCRRWLHGLPDHHRKMALRIAEYVTRPDAYDYLAPEQQGMLGETTPDRVHRLERVIKDALHTKGALDANTHYVLADKLEMQPKQGTYWVSVPEGGEALELELGELEILDAFRDAVQPKAAQALLADKGWEFTESSFNASIAGLLEHGIIRAIRT